MQRPSVVRLIASSLVVLGVYVLALTQIPLDVFWHPDEGGKYLAVEAARFDGGISWKVPYPGSRLDPRRRFYPANPIYPQVDRDGAVTFRWPPLFSIATRPFFDAFGIPGLYALPVVCGGLVALLAGLWARRFVPQASVAAVLIVGLATPVAFYSLGFFEHTATTLLVGLATTALIMLPGRLSSIVIATPLLMLAIVQRAELVAYAAAFPVAWVIGAVARARWQPRGLLRPSRAAWLSILLVIGLLIAGVVVFGELLPERHIRRLLGFQYEIERAWMKRRFFFDSAVRIFLGDPGFTEFTLLRVWQVAALASVFALIAAPFADSRRIEALLVLPALFILLQTALIMTATTVPFLQRQGVLVVAPYVGLGLYGVPEAFRRRDASLLALASLWFLYAVFGFCVLFAVRVAEFEGTTLLGLDGASRYMLPLYPLGAVLALVALVGRPPAGPPRWITTAFQALVAATILVSVAYEALGVKELYAKRSVLVSWREEMRRQEPVLTDQWWLPAVLAPYFAHHEFYVLNRPEDVRHWLKLIANGGVDAFSFASMTSLPQALLRPGLDARDTRTVLDLTVTRIRRVEPPAGEGHP